MEDKQLLEMAQTLDKTREAFESWYVLEVSGCNGEWVQKDDAGDYYERVTRDAWKVWRNASLVALPVQEVHTVEDDFQHFMSYTGYPQDLEDKLRKAYFDGSERELPNTSRCAMKSLNALVADQLRPYLKENQKVIWREAFRWHDDSGVLSNHYDGMEIEQLCDDFGYDFEYSTNMKHAAIITLKEST